MYFVLSNRFHINVKKSPTSYIENVNVGDSSTSNITNINEPPKDLQHHNAICVEPSFLTENVTSTGRYNTQKYSNIYNLF